MKFISTIFSFVLLYHVASAQQIEGRYGRPPSHPKCNNPSDCALKDRPAREEYRSIPVDGDQNLDKVPKKPDEYEPKKEESDSKTYAEDKNPLVPPPTHNSKPVIMHSSTGAGGYGGKPVRGIRGGHNPRLDADYDSYIPKPVRGGYYPGSEEYDTKPSGGGSYRPKPLPDSDEHNYRPNGGYRPTTNKDPHRPAVDKDIYRPPVNKDVHRPALDKDIYRPSVDKDSHRPALDKDIYRPSVDKDGDRPGVDRGVYRPSVDKDTYRPVIDKDIYRPEDKDVSRPRPVPGGGYNKPSRPYEPSYPNKDLGGYNDPKDDDYTYEGGVSGGLKEDPPVKPPLDDSNCICVPYYQCQEGHIVTDGAGIIDARKKPEPVEDFSELPLDGKFRPPTCGPFHVCCNTPETSTVKPYEHRCGVRNPSGINSRILSPSNKGEADFGEWPWQAAVLKAEGKVNIFQCGGVLIDKLHVITVAHCVFHLYQYNEYPLKVRLGEWDTQTTTEFLAHEDYRVSKILVHPEYKNNSLWNDIAILRLEEAVLFAPHIDTVCLPQYDDVFADHNCVVTGWGKDAYKGGSFSNIMKEVALQVIDNYKCEEMLRKTRLGRFFNLHPGFLCAGGEYGLDSCKGDGGGPLVCYRKDKSYALAGIVSWGIDCGQPGVPGVYVKIQKYLDWISQNTGTRLQDYWPKTK